MAVDLQAYIQQNRALSAQNAQLAAQVQALAEEITKLHRIIASANQHRFGKKSETAGSLQLELFSFDTPPAPAVEEEIEIAGHKRTVRRVKTPDCIPVTETVRYLPKETECPCCKTELSTIGEDVTTQIEYQPARFTKTEHVKVKKACRSCDQGGVYTGIIPDGVIPLEGCRPGASLLSAIAVGKYKDHLPLHRQEEIYKRHGVALSRKTMCNWVEKIVEVLDPLYKLIHRKLLEQNYLHADETTIKVQSIDKTGYLWGLHSPSAKLLYFHYNKSRAGSVAKQLFGDAFTGTVLTDAYAGYNGILLPHSVERVACLAHVRRKFVEARKIALTECDAVLKLVAKLYQIEKEKDLDIRFINRQKNAPPILDKLFSYLKALQSSLLPRHALQEALSYAVKQEAEIRRYITNPIFEIDNNCLERLIRPIAVGRKNYLFAGSENGARWAAALYTIIGCCTLAKINPYDYLCDVLLRIQTTKIQQIESLLPHNWDKN